jgi:UDP-N-acetylmuramate dehydrogenase
VKTNVRNILKKINNSSFHGIASLDEKMSKHTTFKVGGAADLYLKPTDESSLLQVATVLREQNLASSHELPLFFLGGGANIVVSDKGIRGVVIDLTELREYRVDAGSIYTGSGMPVDLFVEKAAEAGLSGAEFLAGMPGSVGGAVWMNARCYGSSISDILCSVRYLDLSSTPTICEYQIKQEDFGYKRSPFQKKSDYIILSARFKLHPENDLTIYRRMEEYRADRRQKGHYRFPSAGSVFKNDHAFGAPTGRLLDTLGLRGKKVGDAAVSDFHANIIVNLGAATATDIYTLTEMCRATAKSELGIDLEPEIRFVGDWSDT